jgi:hypothetical protein
MAAVERIEEICCLTDQAAAWVLDWLFPDEAEVAACWPPLTGCLTKPAGSPRLV